MSAPELSAILHRSPVADRVPASVRMFSVLRAGTFGGRCYRVGEIVLVDGVADAQHGMVMVPAGQGRPQFGTLDGVALIGPYGEPCSRQRWNVAGRLLGVARSMGTSWNLEWYEAPEATMPLQASHVAVPVTPAAQVRMAPGQLCLFAA